MKIEKGQLTIKISSQPLFQQVTEQGDQKLTGEILRINVTGLRVQCSPSIHKGFTGHVYQDVAVETKGT